MPAASTAAGQAPREPRGLFGWLGRLEVLIVSVALVAMAILPLAEIVTRRVAGIGIPGAGPFVQHFTLWVAFLGAALAAREGRLLSLATGAFIPEGKWRHHAGVVSAIVAATVSALLARAAFELMIIERESGTVIGPDVPVWIAQLPLPISFMLIALRIVWRASPRWPGRLIAALGIVAGVVIGHFPELMEAQAVWPWLGAVLVGTLLGGPLFVLLGGFALFLFLGDGVPIAAVPVETYRLTVSPTLPAIPLFTLAGFFLSEGRASARLLRVFRAIFGWMPGGTAVVCALVCAFFTAFTGGSGVTILALGALLYKALRQDQYREGFSHGLLTASGSLGLLFPPALPLILYGIVAGVSIENLFIGGLVPGFLLVGMVAAWGVREGILRGSGRTAFDLREAAGALNEAKWELLMPIVVLIAVFGGFATLVEASALAALYAFIVQVVIHKDISIRRDLGRVFFECIVLLGGVLVILGVAMGLTSYMVDAQIPARLLEWTQGHVHSPLLFLLYLNLFLLLVGAVMDIFSAIVVVVPLIVPIGLAFGIHPVHLGIIFVANLELGYLTPPVGLNLYLSSYRFGKSIFAIAKATLPMLAILGIGVLVITYVPILTLGLLRLLGRG